MRKWSAQRGFTLIELMIAVFLSAIVLTFAVPSFRSIVQDNRLVTQINNLTTDLSLARSEAVKRGRRVTVCSGAVAANGDGCASPADWAGGWSAFVDVDGDGTLDTADGDLALRSHVPLEGGLTLDYSGANRITFDARGATTNIGTFALCDDRGAGHARGRIISMTGRVRTADPGGCS